MVASASSVAYHGVDLWAAPPLDGLRGYLAMDMAIRTVELPDTVVRWETLMASGGGG